MSLIDVDQYKDKIHDELIKDQVNKSVQVITAIRDHPDTGDKADRANVPLLQIKLKAAKIILDKWLPDKIEASGGIHITVTRRIIGHNREEIEDE